MRKIELLSPAKSSEHGIEAICHGADAVYIGAPQFSARANASNSIKDIEELTKFAHQYYAKVYVALNTILTDEELPIAEKIIHQLYNAGTDALIIQDFGITQLNLPPIPLHASTQMDNRTVEKVQFLEKAGFEQVVLARELSIDQIREIHSRTQVQLEAFIHGALCVCYSGQCYLSHQMCGRSANRGICAQLCRLPYSLKDADGKVIVSNKHLLSLKDFNLSNHLQELIDAGVSSLKIEGRLKDIAYVKNTTAYYRKQLDQILEGNTNYRKAASGNCEFFFSPNVEKSFHRGSTDYFLHGRNKGITSFDTSKSMGERIGRVKKSIGREIIVETDKELSNGDGFCFLNENNEFSGFKANLTEKDKIIASEKISIKPGTTLFRNFDHAFERILAKKTAERKIAATITVSEATDKSIVFEIIDEDDNHASFAYSDELDIANNPDRQRENITRNLQKCGDTIFSISTVNINTKEVYFFPATTITNIRRTLIEELSNAREKNRQRSNLIFPRTQHSFISDQLDYRANIHNKLAKQFFLDHQVLKVEDSFEQTQKQDAELMRCKHCIKYALNICSKENIATRPKEPLFLETNTGKTIQLFFDCKKCEMILKSPQSNQKV